MNLTILDSGAVKVCCGGNGCPTISEAGDGYVYITDDDGNQIKVKKEEASHFGAAVDKLNTINEGPSIPAGQQLLLEQR